MGQRRMPYRLPWMPALGGGQRDLCPAVSDQPRIARNILKFRYDTLDRARARARELGHRGATFPWRTINGDEASAYYAAGTAQYHINADIAYAIRKYVEVSGDEDFLCRFGAEILVETARFWCDLGFFSDAPWRRLLHQRGDRAGRVHRRRGQQPLHQLDGARKPALRSRYGRGAAARSSGRLRRLVSRTGLETTEPAAWREAAERMYLPWDERLRIHPQDDSFLDKERWDFAGTPGGVTILCCCITTRSISTGRRSSSRRILCWRCSCSASSSRPSRRSAISTITIR